MRPEDEDDLYQAEDYYDDVGSEYDPYEVEIQKSRLANQAQQKISTAETPEFEEYIDAQKTFDLKFIDGVLHQKEIHYTNVMEVLTGNSSVVATTEVWVKIPSETSPQDGLLASI